MGLIKPTPQPPVPGERVVGGLHVVAQGVIGLTVLAMLGILWGWLMSLLARHLGQGVPAALEVCVLVLMGALAVSTLTFGIWAILQNPWFKERARQRAR
ncbi:MAG: hypothetical protein E6J20_21210 [Chloroflexi bacterium]|nr:MAG: hypothetical protein E6J20_21210 [Chloroflexota bacterium]